MNFKHFNLSEARQKLFAGQTAKVKQIDRRKFFKTMGIGAIGLAPIAGSIKKTFGEPFSFKTTVDGFEIKRNGATACKFPASHFLRGATVKVVQQAENYQVKIQGACFNGSKQPFDIFMDIKHSDFGWKMLMQIPQMNLKKEVGFLQWLDGHEIIEADVTPAILFGREGLPSSLAVNGPAALKMDKRWNILFEGENAAALNFCGKKYPVSKLIISSNERQTHKKFVTAPSRSSRLTIPGFKAWADLVKEMQFDEHYAMQAVGAAPALTLLCWDDRANLPHQSFWVNATESSLLFKHQYQKAHEFKLNSFFFFSESNGYDNPQTYLAASVSEKNTWFSNPLGSFLLDSDSDMPDMEALGYGTKLNAYKFAPVITSFKPTVINAIALPTPLATPLRITLAKQADKTMPGMETLLAPAMAADTIKRGLNIRGKLPIDINNKNVAPEVTKPEEQKPVKTSDNKNILNIDKSVIPNAVKENADKGVKHPEVIAGRDIISLMADSLHFRLIRPEDLLLLEFELKNFTVSSKGNEVWVSQKSKKEKGVMYVWFQTQHTIEEAFFESNDIKDPKNPNASSEAVKLPAKFMRAFRTRLVFEYKAGGDDFKFSMDELLNWSRFELRTHPRAWIKLPEEPTAKYSAIKRADISKSVGLTVPVALTKNNVSPYAVVLQQHKFSPGEKSKAYDKSNISLVFDNDVYNSLAMDKLQKSFKEMLETMGPIPDDNTSIEAPALMFISPNQAGGFIHRSSVNKNTALEGQANIYEMWHTKLGVRLKDGRVTDGLPKLRTIRALWAVDANQDYKLLPAPIPPKPFMASLEANDRHKLVHTTSNYSIKNFEPFTVPVNRLMLTPLGAYLDWHAFFDVPSPADTYLNIIEWQHFATLGRDHYVKIVEEGYLFPFGHKAALVKVTERKFMRENRSAVNRKHMYIVILQKEFVYDRNMPDGTFLKFPFQSVEIVNSNTPNIDNPANTTINSGLNGYNFYIHSSGAPFLFDIVATDKEGEVQKFRIPLAFVENVIARNKSNIQSVVADYTGKVNLNTVSFAGQKIAFAQALLEQDTSFETHDFSFGGVAFNSPGEGEICYRPIMQNAFIRLEPVNQITGNNEATQIEMIDDANPGHVFASVKSAKLNFSGGSDKSGGFLSPNMEITGLSRLHGVVGGALEDAMDMTFKAVKFFESVDKYMSAKIFGVIDIFSLFNIAGYDLKGTMDSFMAEVHNIQKTIQEYVDQIKLIESRILEEGRKIESYYNQLKDKNIKDILNDSAKKTQDEIKKEIEKEVEKLRKEQEKEIKKVEDDIKEEVEKIKKQIKEQGLKLAKKLEESIPRVPNLKMYKTDDAFHVQYKWQPDLGDPDKEIIPDILKIHMDKPIEALKVNTHMVKSLDLNSLPVVSTEASFSNFNVVIAESLKVNFNYMKFSGGTSGKGGVNVDLATIPIEFIGALEFVNKLNEYIPSTGFSDNGPYMELTPRGVKAGFSITLPNVEVGIMMISHIMLGAYVNLPFTGDPVTVGFYFARRENPFMLTISCFGGGGFFQLITRLDGLESVEAAFEFGAAISLNVGVASGSVSVMGGIYFKTSAATKEIPDPTDTDKDNKKVIEYTKSDLSAYLRINGRLSILGIITVSLEFYLELHAVIADGRVQKLEGSATLTVKVKVLFFSKKVSVTVRRTLAGSGGDPNFAQMISPDEWGQYCLAFAN